MSLAFFSSACFLHQILHHDRQVANPFAGGREDGVGDRRRNTDAADFAGRLAAEGAWRSGVPTLITSISGMSAFVRHANSA
jgi:hypothetical protein